MSDDDQGNSDPTAPLLATVAQFNVEEELSLANDDPRATQKLAIASGSVRDYLRQFVSRVDDDVVELDCEGPDGSKLIYILPELPVLKADITSVEYVGYDGTLVTADPSTWRLRKSGILECLLWKGVNWRPDQEPITVTYSHGWTTTPPGILGAVLGAAARSYFTPTELESKRLGERSEKYNNYDGGFSPTELLSLDLKRMTR